MPHALTVDDVLRADDARVSAMINSNVAAMETLFSPDLLWFHASGEHDSRATMLTKFANGTLRCFNIERTDIVVRLFDDVSIMTGHIDMDAQIGSVRRAAASRFTGVWQLTGTDGLRPVSWQSARHG